MQTLEGATMPVSVWTSTLRRTIQTAELLPFPKLRWKVRRAPLCGLGKINNFAARAEPFTWRKVVQGAGCS